MISVNWNIFQSITKILYIFDYIRHKENLITILYLNFLSAIPKKSFQRPIKTFHLSKKEPYIWTRHYKTNNFRGLFYGTVERIFGTPDNFSKILKRCCTVVLFLMAPSGADGVSNRTKEHCTIIKINELKILTLFDMRWNQNWLTDPVLVTTCHKFWHETTWHDTNDSVSDNMS